MVHPRPTPHQLCDLDGKSWQRSRARGITDNREYSHLTSIAHAGISRAPVRCPSDTQRPGCRSTRVVDRFDPCSANEAFPEIGADRPIEIEECLRLTEVVRLRSVR